MPGGDPRRGAALPPRAPYLFAFAFLLVVGCSTPAQDGAPPMPSPDPTPTPAVVETTPDAPEDPFATSFKLQDSLATATEADAFADVNPFGYRNPLRSS